MANTINKPKEYINLLDQCYKDAAKTAILDVAPAQVKAANDSGSFYLKNLALVGLGTYSKTAGFPAGDITVAWQEYTYSQDRGRKFEIDAVDDMEAMGAFGDVASEFIRQFVVPELDAYRLAKIAGTSSILGTTGVIDSAAECIAALNAAEVALRNAEVDDNRLVLFLTASVESLVANAAAAEQGCAIFNRAQRIVVPGTRMYTGITVNAGATGSAGGYAKTTGAANINFILMDKGAFFSDAKHLAPRIFRPEVNQTLDAYRFDYRLVHDCWVYTKKTDGIYLHTDESPSP